MKGKNLRLSGYLFVLVGCAFSAAYYFGRQAAFIGAATAFFGVGALYIALARSSSGKT